MSMCAASAGHSLCAHATPSDLLLFSPGVEIGWRLDFAYWGKGLASEAASGALRIAFQSLALEAIVSFTAVRNRRSRVLMARLGLRESDPFDHPRIPKDSPLRRHALYRLSRSDYGA